MPTNQDLPEESEFIDGSYDVGNSPAVSTTPIQPVRRSAVMLPSVRRRNVPDLAAVMQDLLQLDLEGLSVDEAAAFQSDYLRYREEVFAKGFQPHPNSPYVYGLEAIIALGIRNIVFGCLVLRDPEWREAMRVGQQYYQADELTGEQPFEASIDDEVDYHNAA